MLARLCVVATIGDLSDGWEQLASSRTADALRLLAQGNVQDARAKAAGALQARLNVDRRRDLAPVFYEHGRLLASKGQFRKAVDDFEQAVRCDDRNEFFRLRLRTARKALARFSKQNPKSAVQTFRHAMKSRPNVVISELPRASVWAYVEKAGYVVRPPTKLPEQGNLDAFHALGTYRWQGDEKNSDPFSRWIRRMKKGDETVTRHLGRLLAEWTWAEMDCTSDADFLIPVPGARPRENERGFNPPEELARVLEDSLGIPLCLDALHRDASTRARELPYPEVLECFRLGNPRPTVAGRGILLIDDVATRGYTLRACSEHLRHAGAKRIVCIVLAQSVTTRREKSTPGSRK